MTAAGSFRLPPSPAVVSAEGVELRKLSRRHLGLLLKASCDPEVVRWTLIPADLDKEAATRLVDRWTTPAAQGVMRQYAISSRAGGPAVGLVSIALQDPDDAWCADIAYWLLPEGRQRGLVTRAVQSVLWWAFTDGGVRRIALYTMDGNAPSERVAERCGFRFERTVERPVRGQPSTLRRWIMTGGAEPD